MIKKIIGWLTNKILWDYNDDGSPFYRTRKEAREIKRIIKGEKWKK